MRVPRIMSDLYSLVDALPPDESKSLLDMLDADGGDELSPRLHAFVREYLTDLNATRAYVRAGYSPSSADANAQRVMRIPKVARAIARAQEQRARAVGVSQADVLHEMSLLSNSCIDHYLVTDDGHVQPAPGAPDGVMRAIQSIKRKTHVHLDKEGSETGRTYDVEIRLWDKPQPLKLMGRHVGLFADRVEHTGKNGGPIETVSKIERVVIEPNGTHAQDRNSASVSAAASTEQV